VRIFFLKDWADCRSEVEIKLVNRLNTEEILTLNEHPKPIKHLSHSPDGKYLAASCTNGQIYIYDVANLPEQPSLFRTIEGVARQLETSDTATSKAVWHPDGRAFACATATRDIQIVSVSDGAFQRVFSGGHNGDITALAWSSNGALLASAGTDDTLAVWDAKTQKVIRKNKYEKILNIEFHPHAENHVSWTNSWGECSIQPRFFQEEEHINLLQGPNVRAPFYHDPLDDQTRVNGVNGHGQKRRAATPDSLDELLGDAPVDDGGDLDDWIEDDDHAGYTSGVNGVNGNGKRTNGHFDLPLPKRSRYGNFSPQQHPAFQPSSTPWRGNRRYLCLNLLGFAWTVDHDTHRTVTVEFFDRETHRDFHFTDYFGYDKACLTDHGALFASAAKDGQGGVVFYRPHETWVARSDGANGSRIQLPKGEEATSIALSRRYVVAVTTAGYVRVWTLFGTPVKVWRVKNGPAVTCASWSDYVLIVGNGPVGGDGRCKLTYNLEDLRNDEALQSEDVVALSEIAIDVDEEWGLQSVFWSDEGDPCIYDKQGVLLTLMHWRTPGQAKWMPLLDTRRLERLRDGKKEERYWPVAVAGEKFHCVILKGGETSPYFPRPLLTEFDFDVPVGRIIEDGADEDDENGNESNAKTGARLEERFVRSSLLLELLRDSVDAHGDAAGPSLRNEVAKREIEADKLLLQMLAVECREGEERGMKALELVKLMRDRTGKMLEAAAKVASRWNMDVLEEKVREVAERRVGGLEEE
jgi:chromosome transmission fidelity protein 4